MFPTARIEHVGSTAVPGLAAKPILDLLVGCIALETIESLIPELASLRYEYHPEHEAVLPQRRYFDRKSGGASVAHLHAVVLGSPFWVEQLAFRDWLRANPEGAREYEALKRRLAAQFREDRNAYTDAKAPFIQAVLERLRAPGRAPQ